MREHQQQRDLTGLVLARVCRLIATDEYMPYRLLDADETAVEAVAEYFAELQAARSSRSTLYSYGNDLLRWWRFLASVDVAWNHATRSEGRDFMRWMKLADKPSRPHWRAERAAADGTPVPAPRSSTPRRSAARYAASTRAHAETVLRSFYDFHLEAGTGPIVNPFPLDRSRRAGRAHAHHNPLEPFEKARTGRYRPVVPQRLPKRIPDDAFDALFAGLKHHRDRALLAFWVSSAARAEELLGVTQKHAAPGQQVIGVVRKGSGAFQWLPASPDAFVWLRLYQEEQWGRGAPRGRDQPLWCTLRRPWRPLAYPAARAMFTRAQALLGSNYSLHDLRHTAAYRMAEDPQMPITDVQQVLGHASLRTTQLYTAPTHDDVIAAAVAHHRRRAEPRVVPAAAVSSPQYDPASLDVLFGRTS
ncbi:integrase [Amycolatopsis sp. WAC 04182]|uniref:tyrosine-type recombinase/integrase n=1 Tax=Amycolatopsis sp. WAC 04182 TaxID=2203198 RepID=UPI000F7BA8E2|nr:site-specific integrase [Amycolatopsis sp. WAC 04182]RSN60581.1 integrase [Amycolatopsis sp. WAC 04182]